MMKVCLITQNDDFREDLLLQISRYIDNFVCTKEENPDIIVIDDDIVALRQVHDKFPSTPVIFLTAKTDIAEDKLNLLLHKPFLLWKLIDMLHSANNHLDGSEEGILTFNQYKLQPHIRTIIDLATGTETKLTEKEVNILKYLYKTPDKFISKSDLQINVWQYNQEVTTHTIETHIYRLRQKVEKNSGRQLIVTENGKYKLNMGQTCQN